MTLDADTIVDRRRLRRKLTRWRVLAALLVLVLIGGGAFAIYGRSKANFAAGNFIARVTLFDRRAHKVQVSIRALEMAEEKDAIAQYGSSDSGATLGDILGTALKKKEEE